jgi:hypothetical protein
MQDRLAGLVGLVVLILAVILSTISGCSKDKSPTKPSVDDLVRPGAVTNLAAVSPTSSSVTLTWAATGDDSLSGTASQY